MDQESPSASTAVGARIPENDVHAISVSLPTWAATVGWAARDQGVVSCMKTGYPRFFIHPLIQALSFSVAAKYNDLHIEGDDVPAVSRHAMLFPSAHGAERCETYLKSVIEKRRRREINMVITGRPNMQMQTSREQTELDWENVALHAVLYPPDLAKDAKAFWQHTGFGISSRYAELCLLNSKSTSQRNWLALPRNKVDPPFADYYDEPLMGLPTPCPLKQYGKIRKDLVERLAKLYSFLQPVSSQELYLYPTGMTALTMVADAIHHLNLEDPAAEIICYGFLYVDTFKIISKVIRMPTTMLGNCSVKELDDLTKDLESGRKVSAVFVEVPGNPLLYTPDLQRLRSLAIKFNFVLVVDDTIGTPVNVDVMPFADIVCSSLSKMFSGGCNVMGGSVVLNARSSHFEPLKKLFSETYIDSCFPLDMKILEENSRDFEDRVLRANNNAELLADILSRHPTVENVFYPKGSPCQFRYDQYKRPEGGYGFLLSILFKKSAQAVAFFDALDVAKGPSLGTNFTLCCAYTLLAHYAELAWAEEFGVKEHLVRISVGIERTEVLVKKIEAALLAATEIAAGEGYAEVASAETSSAKTESTEPTPIPSSFLLKTATEVGSE